MKIRAATNADRAEWARLRLALWPDCKGRRCELEMREQFSNPRKFGILVIDRGEGLLGGFVELALRDGVDSARQEITGYLEGWYVDQDLRNRGWGRKLIAASERWAAARGMVELASDTELDNEAGITAHRRTGFREVQRGVLFLKRIGTKRRK